MLYWMHLWEQMKGMYLQNPNKVEKTVFENVSESVWPMKNLSGL